jgi:hypothetical protein
LIETLAKPRVDVKDHSPRNIPEIHRALIGPGGKVIQELQNYRNYNCY